MVVLFTEVVKQLSDCMLQIQGFADKFNCVSGCITLRWKWKINRKPVKIATTSELSRNKITYLIFGT